MTTQIVYSDDFSKHNTNGHPENSQRLQVMIEELKKTPFYHDLEFIQPEILPEEMLYDIHSERMIEQIKEISQNEISWIDLDTYVCRSDYKTARLAAGGLLKVCNEISKRQTDNAFALVRPPGHHATKERSMGFCLFNNAAIAANELAKKGNKILIFDPDVHHGNGTQDIFYDRKDVMYQSIHLSPHYPGTGDIDEIGIGEGVGYTVNAPLSYGFGNTIANTVMDEILLPVAKEFKPDFIIMSIGYDSHHLDPLGGLKLTTDFYKDIIKKFQKIQPKIACTLEGGYNLKWISKCFISQISSMVGEEIKIKDETSEVKNSGYLIKEIKNEIGSYWKV